MKNPDLRQHDTEISAETAKDPTAAASSLPPDDPAPDKTSAHAESSWRQRLRQRRKAILRRIEYNRLRRIPEERLLESGFSLAEVEQGLLDAAALYGLDLGGPI